MRRVRNTKIRLFPTLPPSESPSAPSFPTLRAPSAARHAVRLFPAPVPTLPGTQSVRPPRRLPEGTHAVRLCPLPPPPERHPKEDLLRRTLPKSPFKEVSSCSGGGTHGTPRRGGLLRRTGAAVTSRGAYTLPPQQPPAARQTNTPGRRTRRRQPPDRASHKPIHPPTH